MHNTEDKQWWVIEWRKKEDQFVKEVCPKLGLEIIINPDKISNDFAPDLLYGGKVADLKCQTTPFFVSMIRYKIDPQFAVTFNKKDYLRYLKNYPGITIFFWVDWQVLQKELGPNLYRVKPMSGVWQTDIAFLKSLVESNRAPLHTYQNRVGDTKGNAKDSYIIDLRWLKCLHLKGVIVN